jgi:hypothetical protein
VVDLLDTENADTSDQQSDAEWQAKSVRTRYFMSMPHDSEPWTGSHQMTGVSRTPRHMDVIQQAWWAWRSEHLQSSPNAKETDVPRWYCDFSQNCDRKPWGPRPDCITIRTQCYAFHLDRCLDSEDCRGSCALAFGGLLVDCVSNHCRTVLVWGGASVRFCSDIRRSEMGPVDPLLSLYLE